MKKAFCLLACLLLALAVMTGCQGTETPGKESGAHTHTFDPNWANDETDHWHPATCEHDEEISDKAPHADEDGNDVCDVCGYRKDHTHTYEDTWTQGEKTHYYKNTCGHEDVEKYRRDEASHEDQNNDSLCDVCAYDYGHTHEYATEWTKADGGHWHAPTCGHDVPGTDLSDHVDVNNDAICDDCGYDYDHTHTYATEWTTDADLHWHAVTCGHDVPVADKNAHADADGDSQCDTCGYQPEHFHTFDTAWSSDANGHYHKANCGHDAKSDEQPHNGYEQDGVCDTCAYVVFHFYSITVTLPEDTITLKAPDGSSATTFTVKEGTDAVFTLTMPEHILITAMTGATVEGDPVAAETGYHTYTARVSAIQADTSVTMTLKKTSNVQVIVDGGKQEMTIEKAWSKVTGTVTFTAPSVGRYIIYSSSHAGLSGVTFTLEGNTVEQNESGISYAFDVTAAGEITLTYSYFPMQMPEGGKETFTYIVAKIDPTKQLETLEGEGYRMPTNADVTLTFTVPAPGLYQITSSYPVSWDGDVTSPHVFMVEEGQLTRTMTIHYHMETAASFLFDWSIEQLGSTSPVELGSTDVTVPYESYYGITFTPTLSGAYYFSLADRNAALYQWYSSEYWSSMNQLGSEWTSEHIEAGTTVTLYLRTNIYDDEITADIATALSIAYVPAAEGIVYTTPVGVPSVYVSTDWEDSEYILTVPAGAELSVDGGKTWLTQLETTITSYGALAYTVRTSDGSTEVPVTIQKLSYEYTLTLGENSLLMIPDKEYTFTLTGTQSPDYHATYLLHWTDADITVSYGGVTLQSGAEISQYDPYSSTVTVTYSGSETATLTFTLEDGYEVPGIDTTLLSGTYTVNFMSDPELYILTFTPTNTLHGTLTVVDNNQYSSQSWSGDYLYTYAPASGVTVTTLDGETVEIYISANAQGQLTFQCAGLAKPQVLNPQTPAGGEETPDITSDLVLGDNALTVTDGYSGATFTFVAPADGTYTFSYAAGEANGYPMIELESGSETVEFPYTVTLSRGDSLVLIMATGDMNPDTVDIVITSSAAGGEGGGEGGDTPDEGGIKLGLNSIHIPAFAGESITFTATEAGTYTFSWADGEQNGDAMIESATGSESLSFPYSVTLSAGESFTFMLGTADWAEDTVDFTIEKIA